MCKVWRWESKVKFLAVKLANFSVINRYRLSLSFLDGREKWPIFLFMFFCQQTTIFDGDFVPKKVVAPCQ